MWLTRRWNNDIAGKALTWLEPIIKFAISLMGRWPYPKPWISRGKTNEELKLFCHVFLFLDLSCTWFKSCVIVVSYLLINQFIYLFFTDSTNSDWANMANGTSLLSSIQIPSRMEYHLPLQAQREQQPFPTQPAFSMYDANVSVMMTYWIYTPFSKSKSKFELHMYY